MAHDVSGKVEGQLPREVSEDAVDQVPVLRQHEEEDSGDQSSGGRGQEVKMGLVLFVVL